MDASVPRPPSPASGSLMQSLAALRIWWAGLAARERRLATVAGLAVAGLAVWLVALQPAWHTARSVPAQIETLDAQLQTMQRLAGEANELRATPSLGAAQAALALNAASARLGDKARLVVQGERAVLTLNGVSSEALRDWLAEVRSGARARPTEAQLARGAQGFTGTLTVTLGGTL